MADYCSLNLVSFHSRIIEKFGAFPGFNLFYTKNPNQEKLSVQFIKKEESLEFIFEKNILEIAYSGRVGYLKKSLTRFEFGNKITPFSGERLFNNLKKKYLNNPGYREIDENEIIEEKIIYRCPYENTLEKLLKKIEPTIFRFLNLSRLK